MVDLTDHIALVNTLAYGFAMIKRLGKTHWIDTGLKALAAQGVEAVRVERLAKTLGVTKGSFYWHFKTRDELLMALLEAWQARATNDVIATVEEKGGDAARRLHTLFMIVLDTDGRLDMAIRAWAVKDPRAAAALSRIDKTRVAYLETLFEDLAFTPSEATARARLAYNAFVGQYALGAPLKPQGKQSGQFDIIFDLLVSHNST